MHETSFSWLIFYDLLGRKQLVSFEMQSLVQAILDQQREVTIGVDGSFQHGFEEMLVKVFQLGVKYSKQ